MNLAVSLSANADGEAGKLLRAVRRSFPARNLQLLRSPDPLGAVEQGTARLALVSALALFAPGAVDPITGQPRPRPGTEAVALVGTSYLHAFALEPEISRLEQAKFIVTGPEGSSGHLAAQSIIDGLGLSAKLLTVEGDTPEDLAEAMVESVADAAILMQPIGNSTALALLERGLPLIPIDNWTQGKFVLIVHGIGEDVVQAIAVLAGATASEAAQIRIDPARLSLGGASRIMTTPDVRGYACHTATGP